MKKRKKIYNSLTFFQIRRNVERHDATLLVKSGIKKENISESIKHLIQFENSPLIIIFFVGGADGLLDFRVSKILSTYLVSIHPRKLSYRDFLSFLFRDPAFRETRDTKTNVHGYGDGRGRTIRLDDGTRVALFWGEAVRSGAPRPSARFLRSFFP